MDIESLLEQSADDLAGDMPVFSDKPARYKTRKHSNSFSHYGTNGLTINGLPSNEESLTAAFHKVSLTSNNKIPALERKNSRKARNGFNKIGVKKCGSKDIWFRAHDEMDEIELDPRDPEYDSEEEQNPQFFNFEKPDSVDQDKFEETFVNLIKEFFEHNRPQEVYASLKELMISDELKAIIPYLAILTAIPHTTVKCELTSELLTFLYQRYIPSGLMIRGFHKLLNDLPDITLDLPVAPHHIGLFIARAIADKILPYNFLSTSSTNLQDFIYEISSPTFEDKSSHSPPISAPAYNEIKSVESIKTFRTFSGGDHSQSSGVSSGSDSLGASLNGFASVGLAPLPPFDLSEQAQQSLRVAETMLQEAANRAKFDNIWGKHCGLKATTELIKHIQQILTEFTQTKNYQETNNAIKSLDAPHFHHEIVYQIILTAIETGTDDGIELMVNILKYLCDSCVISTDQLTRGVKRVYAEMPLLQTETSLAYSFLNRFIERSTSLQFFPQKLAQERPSKARKRFVSEGDSLHRRI